MKRPVLGFVLAAGTISAAIIGSVELSKPVAEPQRFTTITASGAQRVVGFPGFGKYGPLDYDFVRLVKPSRDGWVFTLRSSALNHVQRMDVHEDAADAGFIYVPVTRDYTPQTAEIQLCGEGDVIVMCPVLMAGVQLDSLPTFDYADAKRRAVRS